MARSPLIFGVDALRFRVLAVACHFLLSPRHQQQVSADPTARQPVFGLYTYPQEVPALLDGSIKSDKKDDDKDDVRINRLSAWRAFVLFASVRLCCWLLCDAEIVRVDEKTIELLSSP